MTVLAAVLTVGCRSTPKPEAPKLAVGWRPAGAWSGQGNTQTESFEIQSGQFRIQWQTTNETAPGAGTFRVTVHSGVSGRPLMLAVDHRGPGSGTAVVTDDPRPYYLEIESSRLDWSISVQEGVVGAVTH